jgi:hypothetical protein
MSNVIKYNFGPENERSGYVIDEDKKCVDGVYCGGISAMKLGDGSVVIGTKTDDGIEQATLTSMKDMNEFCLMWLLIFDESVIKEDLE